jgi:hypothetical protein
MKLARKVGSTSQIFQVFIQDSSSTVGAGLTGLVFNSGSLTAYYHRDTDTTATAISLVTMTVGTFTSSGFKEIDSTNMPGWYQFCPPNTALASGAASVGFHLKGATNMAPLPIEVDLDAQVDVTHWNGTAVTAPNTAGTPVVDVGRINNIASTSVTTINANVGTTQPINFTGTAGSALVKVDAVDILGTAISTPATAGILDVNVKNMNNVAATSITTINANQGTTQPINFTGTAGSALVKGDTVDIAGAAVSTSAAQIGVNVVNAAGTAWASGAITSGVFAANSITASALAADAGAEIADAVLDRDMSTGTDSGSTTVRTARQALRFLRNKWAISGSTLTVYKEDDSTTSWSSTLATTAGVDPVTSSDPAGP